MSPERQLANELRKQLVRTHPVILQLVFPGGQAPYSISLKDETGRQRTIYPDVICASEREVLVGEIKPRFDRRDRAKLLLLKSSAQGTATIYHLLERTTADVHRHKEMRFVLVHAEAGVAPDTLIDQLVFNGSGFTHVRALGSIDAS